MPLFLIFFLTSIFVLGIIVGSFLNVLIARTGTGLGYGGRSFCFSCGHRLFAPDLLPLVSFLFQKGRCRYCRARISIQYPLIECTTGVLFVLIGWKLGVPASYTHAVVMGIYLLAGALLVAIAAYDIRHKIIPDTLVYAFAGLGFLFAVIQFFSGGGYTFFLAGPALAAPFAALWLFSKGRWMGLGDAKLVLGVGWLLGLSGGGAAIILSLWMGAFLGLFMIALGRFFHVTRRLFPYGKRFTSKSEIPFAPFIVAGALIAFLYDVSFFDIQSLFML